MDINQPKSISFSIYLRFLQMGLQVLIASKISLVNVSGCSENFQKVGDIVLYVVIGVNLLAMLITQCSKTFPRALFFFLFVVDLILAAILIILALVGLAQLNTCAANKVLHRVALIEPIIAVVLSFMLMFLNFHWIQRYSNSPGNLVWPFLFFGFAWTSTYKVPMLVLGVLCGIICVTTFLVNLIACKGITTSMKKTVVIQWVFGLILMIVAEVLAIVVYLRGNAGESFNDVVAIKLLQTFICVNLLDLFFWLWGYLTLEYENGDKIRDQLMRGKNDKDFDSQYENEQVRPYQIERDEPGFGTIRH